MLNDPIVEEIHQIREKLLAQYGGDMDKYLDHLKEAEKQHQDRLVTKEQLQAMRDSKRSKP